MANRICTSSLITLISCFLFPLAASAANCESGGGSGGLFGLSKIQPGQHVLQPGHLETLCTLAWTYDGAGSLAGRVYVSTAAHCSTSVGDTYKLLTGGAVFGDVVARGSLESYAAGSPEFTAADWTLIEVRPAFHSKVSGALLNHPQYPTGATSPDQTAVGDIIQLNDLLLIPRQAQLTFDNANIYEVAGLLIPTDSGGPAVHVPTGTALGSVSAVGLITTLGMGADCSANFPVCVVGPTVQGILAQTASAGFPLELRTVCAK